MFKVSVIFGQIAKKAILSLKHVHVPIFCSELRSKGPGRQKVMILIIKNQNGRGKTNL